VYNEEVSLLYNEIKKQYNRKKEIYHLNVYFDTMKSVGGYADGKYYHMDADTFVRTYENCWIWQKKRRGKLCRFV